MKRIALVVVALFLLSGMAYGGSGPVRFLNDTKVVVGGASVYVIDLTRSDFQNAEIFTLQLQTATPYYGGTGATIPVFRWSVANHLPSGASEADVGANAFSASRITELTEWTPIIPNTIIHTSGMSRYVWTFEVDPGKYMMVKADNTGGITNFRMTADLGAANKGQRAKAIHLGTRTYNISQLTGTSTFGGTDSYGETIPEGSRYALIKSAESGNSLWITRRTAVDRDKDPALQSGDVFPVEGSYSELKRIGVAAATTGVKAIVDFYTRKPF